MWWIALAIIAVVTLALVIWLLRNAERLYDGDDTLNKWQDR
jgi:hypothetical protein